MTLENRLGDPGLDTDLARLLHDRGRLPLDRLLGLLTEVRAGRGVGGQTLAQALVSGSVLGTAETETLLAEVKALQDDLQPTRPQAGSAQAWSPGALVGSLVIRRVLGAGGMGTVYLAEDTTTGAELAVKSLPLHSDAESLLRFQREAQAQAAVDRHPNVVRIHRVGQAAGRAYLVMDLAQGGDLASRLEKGGLPPREAASLVRSLAAGLAHVHGSGVLHRDLKPANVLLGEGDVPQLVDFGLARLTGADTLTLSGAVLGTPAYMAPEQVDTGRGELGVATDVYGLGGVLYHALTGRAPFSGASVYGIMLSVLERPPLPPRSIAPAVPPALEAICLRALAKAPQDRQVSAEALGEELDAYLSGDAPVRQATLGWVAWVGLLVAVAGATAWALAVPGAPPKPQAPSVGATAPRAPEPSRVPEPGTRPEPKPPPMTRDLLELRLKQARKTFEGGGLYAIRYSEVADDCEELLRDWPEYPGLRRFAGEACYRAARYWLKQRELDRALGYAQRAVVLDPSARHYFARLGRVLDRRGDYEAAAEAYTTEIKRGSADANLFYHRGTALTALRRYTEALSDFDRVVELAPNHLPDDLRRCRALCQVALKRVDDALAELTETLRVSPEDDAALRMRGSIRARERGLIGPGLEDLNEAVRLGRIKGFEDGNDLSASLLDRAKILRHAGRVDEAVRDLREIGDDPGPFGTLGREILGQILKERE